MFKMINNRLQSVCIRFTHSIMHIIILSLIISSITLSCAFADPMLGSQTVDATGNVGKYTSLALDSNGYPHICYLDVSNIDLKYAKWTGSAWVIQTVDQQGDVGSWPCIALDSNDLPCISYQDSTNSDLKYAKWNGASWDIQVVDSIGKVGMYTSLVLDEDDYPSISYQDYTDYDQKIARWSGTSWDIRTVESSGNVGYYSVIDLDSNDYPCIIYQDISNGALKYAKWTGSNWNIQIIDTTGKVGNTPSLILDNQGIPHVSYFDGNNDDLKYATQAGSTWTVQTIDSAGRVGMYSSLALDLEENPIISYFDSGNGDLKLAKWSGSNWGIQLLDSITNTGMYSSIAVYTDGMIGISYHDYENGDLRYLKITEPTPVSTNLRVNVEDSNMNPVSGAAVISSIQPTGQPALSGITGADGSVTFPDILPGSITLQVSKTNYETNTASLNIEIGENAEITVSIIETPSKGELLINVKNKEGAPLEAVIVTSTSQPSGQTPLSGSTNNEGAVSFKDLLPGSYTISASKTGYTTDTSQLTVSVGKSNDFSLVLEVPASSSEGGIPGFSLIAIQLGLILATIRLILRRK
ncbi:carboxypeptidase regulatory-like domain-containing protein [Candidatus Bathyarchaeota archaeon]|nr:MAG: carboxypeptidase regulatory-like domain-containing protein [Candidatus Bathyarchaeota archaeon]